MAKDRREMTGRPNPRGVRVLHVYEPATGGVPNYVRAVAAGHNALGFRSATAGPPILGASVAIGQHIQVFETSNRTSLRRNVRAVRQLLRVSREFDLLHGHSSVAGLMVAVVGLMRRVPTVYTPHTWSFQRDLPSVWRWLYIVLERLLATAHARVVTVSFSEADAAIKHRILDERKLDTVQTGVLPGSVGGALRAEARATLGCSEDETIIAWVGRNDPAKRPGDLKFIQERLPGLGRIFAMGIGLRGSSYDHALTAAGGVVVDPEVGTSVLYAAADLFLMTSAWEASPLSVLEALSNGLPVAAYAVGDIPKMVLDRQTGLLVPPGDSEALVARLAELAVDVPLRLAMATHAKLDVQERFCFDNTLSQILDSYSSVLPRDREVW